MNVKTLIAASAVALLGVTQFAVAQEAPKTRAQVQAELVAARAAGQLSHGDRDVAFPTPITSTKTRAQVQAEFAQAREMGLSFNGSKSEGFDVPAATAQRTRAEVRAEVREAIANGERLSQGSASN